MRYLLFSAVQIVRSNIPLLLSASGSITFNCRFVYAKRVHLCFWTMHSNMGVNSHEIVPLKVIIKHREERTIHILDQGSLPSRDPNRCMKEGAGGCKEPLKYSSRNAILSYCLKQNWGSNSSLVQYSLKGQSHEIFCTWFFQPNSSSWSH